MMRRLVIACVALIFAAIPAAIALLMLGDVALVQGLSLPSPTSSAVTTEVLGPPPTPSPTASRPSDNIGGDRPRGTTADKPGDIPGNPGPDDDSGSSAHGSDDSSPHSGGEGTSVSDGGSGDDHGGGHDVEHSIGHGSDD